eukprot:4176732-Prymnesium_polylepis.2
MHSRSGGVGTRGARLTRFTRGNTYRFPIGHTHERGGTGPSPRSPSHYAQGVPRGAALTALALAHRWKTQ